jgi:hypothetical protein
MDETVDTSVQDNTEAVATEETTTNPAETAVETAEVTDTAEPTTTEETIVTEPPGAPETYTDFTLPDGLTAPTEEFKTWAKENNMTQEKAQSAIDFYTKTIVPQQQAAQVAQNEAWVKESTEKYGKQGIEAANKALGRFSTPEFTKFLTDTGLGNHPEMIGIFNTINARISESSFVDAKTKQASKVLFPNSPDMYK